MTEPLPLGAGQLAMAASLLCVNGALSIWLGLGLERRLAVAAVRATVQLMLLGWILVPVFELQHPGLVLAVCAVMGVLAAREAVGRSSRGIRGLFGSSLVAMAVGGGGTAVLATVVVIGVEPWWTPQYLVPLVGMVLGNALNGVSLGVDRALTLVDERRDAVEALVVRGATRFEAARPVAAEAVRTGMLPILNTLSAVGLVTIPGMMTGQILAGTAPGLAARYQLLILFLIAGAVASGTAIAVGGALLLVFDSEHRLRVERIRRR